MVIDPELRHVLDVWATLNERDRAILLGLVDALQDRQDHEDDPVERG